MRENQKQKRFRRIFNPVLQDLSPFPGPFEQAPLPSNGLPPPLPESQAVLQLQNRKEAFNPTQGKHVV